MFSWIKANATDLLKAENALIVEAATFAQNKVLNADPNCDHAPPITAPPACSVHVAACLPTDEASSEEVDAQTPNPVPLSESSAPHIGVVEWFQKDVPVRLEGHNNAYLHTIAYFNRSVYTREQVDRMLEEGRQRIIMESANSVRSQPAQSGINNSVTAESGVSTQEPLTTDAENERQEEATEGGDLPEPKFVVFVPGYGCGGALYARPACLLVCEEPNTIVFSLDWLGTGLSYFPNLGLTSTLPVSEGTLPFIETLESWRRNMGIEKFVLGAHSLGGHISTLYCLRYPNVVERLILISAIGLPRRPDGGEAPQAKHIPPGGQMILNFGRMMYRHFELTPMSFLRGCGPFGPAIVKRFMEARLGNREDSPLSHNAYTDYLYHYNAQPSDGEAVIRVVLDEFAYGREPLIDKLQDIQVPVSFLHGESDWVGPQTGHHFSCQNPKHYQLRIVDNCGHQIFLENPREFVRTIRDIFLGVEPVPFNLERFQREHPHVCR